MTANNRALDWLHQAQDDMNWAEDSLRSGHFPQTCFVCQQVAEKAMKALAFWRGADMVKGHSVTKIAKALKINAEIEQAAKKLDLYYVSGRYPDAFPAGRPTEFITEPDAKEALQLAKVILSAINKEMV